MPPKKKAAKKTGPKKRKTPRKVLIINPQHGTGFFGDVWDGVKKVGGFLKDSKILSTVGSMIPHAGVQTGARFLGQLGLGPDGRPVGIRSHTVRYPNNGGLY